MFYKNTGPSVKTFYGVTFKPGEVKEVNGRIYHHRFLQVSEPKEPPVATELPKSIIETPIQQEVRTRNKNRGGTLSNIETVSKPPEDIVGEESSSSDTSTDNGESIIENVNIEQEDK